MDLDLPLRGPAGEPVDLHRTLLSHGLISLPPMAIDEGVGTIEVTLPVPGGPPRLVRVQPGKPGYARMDVAGRAPGARAREALLASVRRILNLDEDLSAFYAVAASDPDLAWVTAGAARMARSPTVFEDLVKTLFTTNCSWALTIKMTSALVASLGEPSAGADPEGPRGRAFPTPEAMAAHDERFYREVVRSGYRAPHLVWLSRAVADGSLDLEALADPSLTEEEVEARLLAIPGIGPYASALMLLLLGRYSRLILDSWSRPTYARLAGYKVTPKDSTILRRFRRYGPYAGLAFWCAITRDWLTPPPREAAPAPA